MSRLSSPTVKSGWTAILVRGLAWWLCLILPLAAQAATVSATLDRHTVSLGDTVTLNLRIAGGGFASPPDLSPLQADFDVLGQSQSSNLSIVNGQRSSELVIGVVLRPRRAGTLTIPALTVDGMQTAPMSITVRPASAASAAAPDSNLFMESDVEPRQAWVGQQLSYVVKIFYRGNLSGGALDALQVDGVQLSQVGQDLHYDSVRGGNTYHVIERRYALVPQHAGALTIPALGFQGEALDPGNPDSFFGIGDQVSASAPPVTVQVQPVPANWGTSAWLPARALSLTLSGWPAAGTPVRVGQPINLQMRLSATGVPADALPALSLPAISGATVYPDRAKTSTGNDGPWLVGGSQRGFAVVPEQAGTLTMPATTLRWFDVTSGQVRTAEIPAHTLTVLPAAGAAPAAPAATAPASATAAAPAATAAPAVTASPVSGAVGSPVPWRWIALASLALWLASFAAWWWLHRRRAPHPEAVAAPTVAPSARERRAAFLAAARGHDASAQLHALLAWAQAERPAIRQPGELAAALADAAQRQALQALQRRCYGGAAAGPDGATLVAAFQAGLAWRAGDEPDTDELPPLYPFKLR
jgi:hypothetical protein